jgi:hypothetical protein
MGVATGVMFVDGKAALINWVGCDERWPNSRSMSGVCIAGWVLSVLDAPYPIVWHFHLEMGKQSWLSFILNNSDSYGLAVQRSWLQLIPAATVSRGRLCSLPGG